MDLNRLIGQRFSLQGIEFEGVEECRPCYWMDQAIAPGAENYLKGHGGLRAHPYWRNSKTQLNVKHQQGVLCRSTHTIHKIE